MPCFANVLSNHSQFSKHLSTNFNALQISPNTAEMLITILLSYYKQTFDVGACYLTQIDL